MGEKNIKIEDTDKSNYEQNISVLNTLKRNPKKYKKKFNFFNVTYYELFNEYLDSKEFEESIYDLRRKKFYFDYIQNYIQIAENLVNYYKK